LKQRSRKGDPVRRWVDLTGGLESGVSEIETASLGLDFSALCERTWRSCGDLYLFAGALKASWRGTIGGVVGGDGNAMNGGSGKFDNDNGESVTCELLPGIGLADDGEFDCAGRGEERKPVDWLLVSKSIKEWRLQLDEGELNLLEVSIDDLVCNVGDAGAINREQAVIFGAWGWFGGVLE
jgi:hypothetical protein